MTFNTKKIKNRFKYRMQKKQNINKKDITQCNFCYQIRLDKTLLYQNISRRSVYVSVCQSDEVVLCPQPANLGM